MAKPSAEAIKCNIQAEDQDVWNEADQRPTGLDTFESDLAAAIAATWSIVEDAFLIGVVPVSGGASAPGGPLQGGIASLTPGLLTNSASFMDIAKNFSSSFPDAATEGLLALVDAVSQAIGSNFPLWVAGYSATLTASGGTCAWIPGPPTPAPGPWAGGSIEDFPLVNGTSAGDSGMTAASLELAIDTAADPAILKQNENKFQPALAALVSAIAKGFESTWSQWKKDTKISGGTGSGTAVPPSGSIAIGVVASPVIS